MEYESNGTSSCDGDGATFEAMIAAVAEASDRYDLPAHDPLLAASMLNGATDNPAASQHTWTRIHTRYHEVRQ